MDLTHKSELKSKKKNAPKDQKQNYKPVLKSNQETKIIKKTALHGIDDNLGET